MPLTPPERGEGSSSALPKREATRQVQGFDSSPYHPSNPLFPVSTVILMSRDVSESWGQSCTVLQQELMCFQVFFIESVCDDPEVIEANIMVRNRVRTRVNVWSCGKCGKTKHVFWWAMTGSETEQPGLWGLWQRGGTGGLFEAYRMLQNDLCSPGWRKGQVKLQSTAEC